MTLKKLIFTYLSDSDMDYSYNSCSKDELRKRILLLEATKRLITTSDEVTEQLIPSCEYRPSYFEEFKRNLRETLESYRGVYFQRFNERLRLRSSTIQAMMNKIQVECGEK